MTVFPQLPPDPPIEAPEVVWSSIAPLVTLAVGAVLLIMFRSVVKRLPAEVERTATIAVGPVTVLAAWIVGGMVGSDVPLDGVRDDIGEPLFYLGLIAALVVGGMVVRGMRIGFDAAFTMGTGLVAFAATVVRWQNADLLDSTGAPTSPLAFGVAGDADAKRRRSKRKKRGPPTLVVLPMEGDGKRGRKLGRTLGHFDCFFVPLIK